MDAETYAARFSELKKKIEAFLGDDRVNSDNIARRRLYGLVDRLRLDVEEVAEDNALKGVNAWPSESQLNDVNAELNLALRSIPLVAVRRSMKESFFFYNPVFILLETYIRFVGVACSIFFAGAFLSIPILLLRVIDVQLQRDPYKYYSEALKKVVTTVVLYQAGLQVTILGLSPDLLASTNCFIMAFTHACNIDGFIVAGTCPVRQLAFGKKELFMAPFFSWLSLAIGNGAVALRICMGGCETSLSFRCLTCPRLLSHRQAEFQSIAGIGNEPSRPWNALSRMRRHRATVARCA